MVSKIKTDELKALFMALHQNHKLFSEDHRAQTIPKQVYVDSMTPIHRRMADILPSRSDCDRLLKTYFFTSENLYRVVHIPTFRDKYLAYWNNEPRPDSFLPLLLVVMALATKFESRSQGPNGERLNGINVPTACTLVRMWLDGLKGKELVDMSTLKTEVILSYAQRMVLKPQESWSRLGFIVRMAMSMGMHRDPSEFGHQMPPFEGELRRRLWWTILDMDLHMSLQCNMPCAIRDDDFTCRCPLNLNDEDIYPGIEELPEEKPHDQHTSCQLLVHAAKTLRHRLKAVNLINRIDTADENEILDAGAKLEHMLENVHFNFPRPAVVSDQESITRWRTRIVLDMHCRRPLLALYRPFALAPLSVEPPPSYITRSYLRSAMTLLNYLEDLDPSSQWFGLMQHQYYLYLGQDILQATFSVCYYIRDEVLRQRQRSRHSVTAFADATSPLTKQSSLHSGVSNAPPRNPPWDGGWAATTPEFSSPIDDGLGSGAAASSHGVGFDGCFDESPCSLKRMEETVSRTLETLVSRIREIGSDLKDFVSISVVLSTSRMVAASPEQKLEDIKLGMRKILDACTTVKNSIVEQQPASFLQAQSVPALGQDFATPRGISFSGAQQPHPFHPYLPTIVRSLQ